METTRTAGHPAGLAWEEDLTHRWRGPAAAREEPVAIDEEESWAAAAPARGGVGRTLVGSGWLRPLLVAALALILVSGGMTAVEWARVRLDDLRYGRPRTTQLTAFVGHGEAEGAPTHLFAMNLNRRITIIELPGGDATRVRTILGPYLVGRDEDLTLATMRLVDVNADGHADLLVRVKQEELVFINDRGEFRLMSRVERPAVERALGGGQ